MQLLGLDSCRPVECQATTRSDALKHVESPVQLEVWKAALASHPDQRFAEFIIDGLGQGFRIGFQHGKATLWQEGTNMHCPDHTVVSEYLATEVKLNRVVKMSRLEASRMNIHCSPIGVIPKKNKSGKWRLIVDLSTPEGRSVYDSIDKDMISLSYTSVDNIAARVIQLGRAGVRYLHTIS